ncbi:MAG TPA: Clp protease N-terminal domain-containing protein [Tepidisphaeraceae bacterium]|nr:Clp protease N-terminal domain-containing protein [Tepidisphaeraceae bacterium]
MFDRFTDRARRAVVLAGQEAMRLRHDHIGTEHLLLGMVKEGSGLAAIVLDKFNVGLPTVRQQVESLAHAPATTIVPAKLRQTDRYTRVINYAIEESQLLSHNYVGTEHLLLGLLREPEGTAARVLAGLNLKLDDVRAAVLTVLGKAPQNKDALMTQAVNDLATRLADEVIEPEKVKAVAEALINAGWRPAKQ